MKKAQITIFMIIGIIIASVILIFYMTKDSSKEEILLSDMDAALSFTSVRGSLQNYVSECVKLTTLNAIDNYGLIDSENSIDWYIEHNLKGCTQGFPEFIKLGFSVKEGGVEAEVDITDSSVVVEVNYPVSVTREGKKAEIEDFFYLIDRTVEVDADVQEVILLKQTFKPVSPKKSAKKAGKSIRLVGAERLLYADEAYLILDKTGREVAAEQVPQAPSEEEPEKILAEFGEKIERLEVPENLGVSVVRSRIVKRPSDIERVVEELFEVSERTIIYTPVYEVSFQNTRTGEVKSLKIDGITAKAVS